MKVNHFSLVLLTVLITSPSYGAENGVVSGFRRAGDKGEVLVQSRLNLPVSSMVAEYTIYRSTNFTDWEPVAGPFAGGVGVSDEVLRQAVPLAGDRAFYRVSASIKLAAEGDKLGSSIYGYGTEFSRQLQDLGQMSLADFASHYTPAVPYLDQLSFSPTAADYWTNFSTNAVFQLNSNELTMFTTNGFVVSQRLGSYSFARSFYDIFTADLPVYVSCDSVLHAWHRSYVNMLEELEESYLSPILEFLLNSMGNQVSTLSQQAAGSALSDGVRDADFFIAVARSLLTGTNNYGALGQEEAVLQTLNAIASLQPAEIPLFGSSRAIDFSQFQVRGHYATSARLGRYFRAMMWCQLVDFRFTGSTTDNSLRELSGAIAMHLLLKDSSMFSYWQYMEKTIQMFVGAPDAMTFAQLNDLLVAAGVQSPANVTDQAALQNIQAALMSGALGVQNIQSGFFWSPLTREQIKLPRSLAVIPGRFTVDGWTTSQCVFDRIVWDEDGIPGFEDKVMRRVPSALDVAFAALANDHATPMIVKRIANPAGHPWRDGYPYQHNLAAVRRTLDSQEPAGWTNSIYQDWLGCLRELSGPTTGPEFPETMRTRNWAMKTLNTQLASWTQLRHDTVLYAKQPYTGNILCSYPKGFVEPRVGFWLRLGEMALRTRALLSTLPAGSGQFVFEPHAGGQPLTNSMIAMHTNRLNFLQNFANRMTTLAAISTKELAREPLSAEETFFLESVIENPAGYSGALTYSGWYPTLFFQNTRAAYSGGLSVCDLWDPLVTDVHTDPFEPIVGDPGCVLHQGVGNAALLMIAVKWGPGDSGVYAGPVFTHYEFELGPTTRMTDSEWKADIKAGRMPPLPEWTRGFQIPGNISSYPWQPWF